MSRRAEAAAARLEAARAQTDAARAQESGARTMLGYTRLAAPFAGVVTARMADPGTMAAPGRAFASDGSSRALQLQASVDESAIGAIHKGMKVPGGNRWQRIHSEYRTWRHGGRDCSCRRSVEPQFSRQDRPASFKPIARRHVWNGGVCQRRTAGDPHSAFRCRRARLAGLRLCSRRPGSCATPLPSPSARRRAISSKFCRASPWRKAC